MNNNQKKEEEEENQNRSLLTFSVFGKALKSMIICDGRERKMRKIDKWVTQNLKH